MIYDAGEHYRFELKSGTVYTGEILATDRTHIKILTMRDEKIVICKNEIKKAKLLSEE